MLPLPAPRPRSDRPQPPRCYFCGTHQPEVDEAIDAGWVPSFIGYEGVESADPVCPACTARLRWDGEEYHRK